MKRFFCPFLAALLLVCGGCGKRFFTPEKEILAEVNGRLITKKDIERRAKLYDIKITDSGELEKFLNLVINDYLIIDEAKKDGISITKDELREEMEKFVPGYSPREIKKVLRKGDVSYRYWLQDVKEKILRKKEINHAMRKMINMDDDRIKDYFWTNIIHFRRVRKVRARQVVVESREKAEKLLEKIKKGADFSEIAGEHSVTAGAEKGGDLGFVRKRDLPGFMAREIFKMKEGSVSHVVKSPYGYHIFKCEDIALAETPEYEEVREEVYDRYFKEKKDRYFSDWMEDVRRGAEIKIYDDNLKEIFKEEKK